VVARAVVVDVAKGDMLAKVMSIMMALGGLAPMNAPVHDAGGVPVGEPREPVHDPHSSGSAPRRATARRTARRRRSVVICTSRAAAWAAATSVTLASRPSTRSIAGRSTPSSRSVRTSSSRASAASP